MADSYKPSINCSSCGKETPLEDLITFHDRNGFYSGRACSERCGRDLPGQGPRWNYDHVGAGERLYEPD